MDTCSYELLAGVLGAALLGSDQSLDPVLVDAYWAGDVQIPSAVDSDVESYLSKLDSHALTRAAVWIARNHVLSGYKPRHHLHLVRWLLEQGLIERSELLNLVALETLHGQLDAEGKEIALLSREMLDEARLVEGLDLIEPMLLAYRAPI